MHCKVYLSPGSGAVVGSANLSKAGLQADEGISGQDEAGVYIPAGSMVGDVEEWFENLWKNTSTRPITPGDLNAAKKAYDSRAKMRGRHAQNSSGTDKSSIIDIPTSISQHRLIL